MRNIYSIFLFLSIFFACSISEPLNAKLQGEWVDEDASGKKLVVVFNGTSFTWTDGESQTKEGVFKFYYNEKLSNAKERAILVLNFGPEYDNVSKVENFYFYFEDKDFKILRLKSVKLVDGDFSKFVKVEKSK